MDSRESLELRLTSREYRSPLTGFKKIIHAAEIFSGPHDPPVFQRPKNLPENFYFLSLEDLTGNNIIRFHGKELPQE